jgi:hypothetical protein
MKVELDKTGSESCSVAGYGISDTEPPGDPVLPYGMTSKKVYLPGAGERIYQVNCGIKNDANFIPPIALLWRGAQEPY